MRKKVLSLLLILSLIFTMMPTVAFADDTVTATIRVESTTETLIPETEITMSENDLSEYGLKEKSPGYVTPLHILCEYIQNYEGGDVPDNLTIKSGLISEILGSNGGTTSNGNSAGWIFAVSNKFPLDINNKGAATMSNYVVKNGDEIVIYAHDYEQINTAKYTYFGKREYSGEAITPIEVDLKGWLTKDVMSGSSTETTELDVSDAKLYISEYGEKLSYKKTDYITDSKGKAKINIDKPGEYALTAGPKGNVYDISRPYAKLIIHEPSSEGAAEIISSDIQALSIEGETNTHLELPSRGSSGKTKIEWQSSDKDIISDSGKVKRPTPAAGDKNITLTAVVSRGNVSESKNFEIKVPAYESNEEINDIINSIFSVIDGYEADEETDTNIIEIFQNFADEKLYGSKISIISSENPGIDPITGDITYNDSKQTGNLSVSCEFAGITNTKDISVTVPQHEKTLQDIVNEAAAKITWDSIKNSNTGTSDEVISNLSLKQGSSMEAVIKWTSSDESIINILGSSGYVYRPTRTAGNKDVILKATVSPGQYAGMMGYKGTTKPVTVELPVTVLAFTEEDEAAGKIDVDAYADVVSKHAFTYFYDGSVIDPGAVINDINLNLTPTSGIKYSYDSTNPSVEINSMRGKVKRPNIGSPDTSGKLILKLNKNGYTKNVEFDIIVKALSQQEVDEENAYLNTVKNELDFDVIKNGNEDDNNVVSDLRVPYRKKIDNTWGFSNTGSNGAVIEYVSSDIDATPTVNTVVRPGLNKADKKVELTATIKSQKIVHEAVPAVTKKINFTVPALSNLLSNISVDKGEIAPGFEPKKYTYIVELPYGETTANLSLIKRDQTAGLLVTGAVEEADHTYKLTMDKASKVVNVRVEQSGIENDYNIVFKNKPLEEVTEEWSSYRSENNSGITQGKTPRATDEIAKAWSADLNATDDWGFSISGNSPIVIDDLIYVIDGDNLRAFSKSGVQVKNAKLAEKGGSTSRLAYGQGMLFASLGDGRIQALNAKTLDSLWISREMPPGYTIGSTITYQNGYVYSGAVKDNYVKTTGSFFCIDVTDENTSVPDETKYFEWEHISTSESGRTGYLWTGAYATDDYILFGGDDGILVSRSSGNNKVLDTYDAGASIRSDITFNNGYAYFTTQNGQLKKVKINNNGTIDKNDISSTSLAIASSTSTPVIYDGKAYAISGDFISGGRLDVIDIKTMRVLSTVDIGGYSQSSPLLSSSYANASNGNAVFLYVVLNDDNSDIMVIENSNKLSKPKVSRLYRPVGSYSMGSVISDSNGTLYFIDGYGNLNAIESKKLSYPINEKYTISFHANGGNYTPGSIRSKIVYNTLTYGNMASISKKGYKFNGWFTAPKSGLKITAATVVNLDKDQTLYAQWTPNKYTVKYNANKGKIKKKSKRVTYGNKYGKLAKPKRKGYIFKGWYTKKKGGKKIKANSKVAITKNIKLYARWKKK